MKTLISIIFLLCSFICNGQVKVYSYNSRITELIEKNNNSTISKAEKFELQKYGYNIQLLKEKEGIVTKSIYDKG
ncbi:hypothetical protein [Plebeiibacterium marinum]|uniref:Uncharacterized protein n=1 Tax=Plebeiibacterium marinum TaxID=2992111 RepID=A0AAE3SLS3_9BACT|nr:hypothetical protein [Plebeiobacterium marinum]MCW3807997.1 hypothetical protein [Plebeiobacterium marinum]